MKIQEGLSHSLRAFLNVFRVTGLQRCLLGGVYCRFSVHCCLGWRLVIAASDGVTGFSFFCGVNTAFLSLVLLHFEVAGGVDFDPWPCWWAPVQG